MIAGPMPNWGIFQMSTKLLIYTYLRMVCLRLLCGHPEEIGGSHAAAGGFQPVSCVAAFVAQGKK
jgi:hypothetical protein